METKYIRFHDGTIVIFNEASGFKHFTIAQHLRRRAPFKEISDAGFVYHENGVFIVYGQSVGLRVACDSIAGGDLTSAMRRGELFIRKIDGSDSFYAVTDGDGEVADIDSLYLNRILIKEPT